VGGPSQWLFRGHLHDELDATFTATAHSFHGHAADLCAQTFARCQRMCPTGLDLSSAQE